jgi:hypothetical protein
LTRIDVQAPPERPYRPRLVALFDALGRAAAHAGLRPSLDPDSLIAAARRQTGLADFGGDEWFREPLARLTDSMEREARLTPLGRVVMRGQLVRNLGARLRTVKLLAEHPEIRDLPLDRLIVIAGLQRTGTTMLHRHLGAMPGARALLSWEALSPLPLPGEAPDDPRKRIAAARMAERGVRYLAPAFFAIHPVEHDAPEEDVLLLDHSFMSQAPEATMHVPGYAAWLEKQDQRRAYEHMALLLRILLWQRPGSHWVLKTPHHLEYLEALLDVLPGARVVQTHRDPRRTTASFCSMVTHGRGIFSDHVDPREVGRHWMRKIDHVVHAAMHARERLPPDRFLDVSYYDLMEDPIGQLERIHAFAGLPFGDAEREVARRTRERNVQHKYGRHRYTLADFGLSESEIERRLGDYCAHHAIPREGDGRAGAAPDGPA